MLRCITLAKNGLGTTAPNPMVGCVVVYDKKIIGEGYTSPYGGAHAEVNAINSVKDKSILSKSTLYVTLEPCAHYGRTPPCVNLILKHKIPRVVIGIKDPNKKVAGKSISLLKEDGCEVVLGVLKKECRQHHQRFLSFQEKQRPYIILKWAETLDGFIAPDESLRRKNPEPYWITNTHSKQLVHKWRTEEQAILIGTKTALEDNPKLTVRNWKGTNPIRIVLDKELKIPANYHLLDTTVKTIILTTITDTTKYIDEINYEVIPFENIPKEVATIAYSYEINSIIIEGGTTILQSFIDVNLWDEARIFKGNTSFIKGIKAPVIAGKEIEKQQLLNDELIILTND